MPYLGSHLILGHMRVYHWVDFPYDSKDGKGKCPLYDFEVNEPTYDAKILDLMKGTHFPKGDDTS